MSVSYVVAVIILVLFFIQFVVVMGFIAYRAERETYMIDSADIVRRLLEETPMTPMQPDTKESLERKYNIMVFKRQS